ncbi:hypothetical protein B5F33_06400 [Collinsella sp. An2]|nr:hypothetical protein B5F33_06400 [Collinsella sp. An2]
MKGSFMYELQTQHPSTNAAAFLSKLTEHQLYAREFFNKELLNSINQMSSPDNIAFYYFNTHGQFLSVLTQDGLTLKADSPYASYAGLDVVRHTAHRDAVHDHLTYFNTTPRLYKSTDVISGDHYDESSYTAYIEEHFGCHYSVTLAFGMFAYIQVVLYKTKEHGDFTQEEMNWLEQLYIYLASAYRTFKKYEQSNIIADIMSKVIDSGERAFFVCDDFSHMLSCNEMAENCLDELLGPQALDTMNPEDTCPWLPFLIDAHENEPAGSIHEHTIKDFTFRVRVYDRTYSNGIVDRYYWVTILRKGEQQSHEKSSPLSLFTRSEQHVASLLDQGLTYQEIADELVISFHTVKKHVQSIYKKCGVKNRAQFSCWLKKARKA